MKNARKKIKQTCALFCEQVTSAVIDIFLGLHSYEMPWNMGATTKGLPAVSFQLASRFCAVFLKPFFTHLHQEIPACLHALA